MDLRTEILKEHSKTQCDKIVQYIGKDARKFSSLMKLFLGSEYRVTQRAGWPLSYCVQAHPELIKPYFKQILTLLQKPDVHNAIHRNIVRLLQHVELPKRFHGQIMSICFDFIANQATAVAIKAFSLTVLDQLSKQYPEIMPELKLVIEERWPHETAAFRSRAKKILK